MEKNVNLKAIPRFMYIKCKPQEIKNIIHSVINTLFNTSCVNQLLLLPC